MDWHARHGHQQGAGQIDTPPPAGSVVGARARLADEPRGLETACSWSTGAVTRGNDATYNGPWSAPPSASYRGRPGLPALRGAIPDLLDLHVDAFRSLVASGVLSGVTTSRRPASCPASTHCLGRLRHDQPERGTPPCSKGCAGFSPALSDDRRCCVVPVIYSSAVPGAWRCASRRRSKPPPPTTCHLGPSAHLGPADGSPSHAPALLRRTGRRSYRRLRRNATNCPTPTPRTTARAPPSQSRLDRLTRWRAVGHPDLRVLSATVSDRVLPLGGTERSWAGSRTSVQPRQLVECPGGQARPPPASRP